MKTATVVRAPATDAHGSAGPGVSPPQAARPNRRHRILWATWHICTVLLVISILLLAYSAAWEYSTRRYLKGFSDAIVPAGSTPVGKAQAILNWMAGPAAQDSTRPESGSDRNPEDTLNYTSLLNVCGTATNAFINLADSAGLRARRLLLLDSKRTTKHVVAEVLIGGRWIVVDPVFRYIPRGPDGALLTRGQLADPKMFSEATRDVPNYDPAYNYQVTAHVHLARVPYIGAFLRRMLNSLIPGWSDSWEISLLLERESLAVLILSLVLVVFALLWRLGLRWYAAARLDVRPLHVHERLASACKSFFRLAI
jgi:Transglutaminase-like superfamily